MLNAELEPEPEDVIRLKQAAGEGNADAQGVYARLLARDDAGILAAVPWYCKAMQQGNKEAALDLYEFYLADDRVRELAHRFLSVEEMARWQRWYRRDRLRSSVPLAAITCTLMVLFGVGGICLYGMEGNALLYSLLSGWAVGALVEYLFFRLL